MKIKILIYIFISLFSFISYSQESIMKTIVIDPGHGGRDSGGIHGFDFGYNQITYSKKGKKIKKKTAIITVKEKDINLYVAKLLKEKLENLYNVVMTRDNDTFIPLNERINIANNMSAALFISIHCDAMYHAKTIGKNKKRHSVITNGDENGFSIYYSSKERNDSSKKIDMFKYYSGETDSELNMIKYENSYFTEDKHVVPEIYETMYHYAQNLELETALTKSLLKDIEKKTGDSYFYKGIMDKNYFVLRKARVPAVLVELGFLSTKSNMKKLIDKDYQNKMAEAIAGAIYKCID